MQHITLITGGVKSGKSSHALHLGRGAGGRRSFIATATALDEEMARKIAAHRRQRGDAWTTYEEPRDVPAALESASASSDIVLVDCMTLWVSNLLTLCGLPEAALAAEFDRLVHALAAARCPVILVTNEVGLGIMPAEKLSRTYQRLLGSLNAMIAERACSVILMISGIPVTVK